MSWLLVLSDLIEMLKILYEKENYMPPKPYEKVNIKVNAKEVNENPNPSVSSSKKWDATRDATGSSRVKLPDTPGTGMEAFKNALDRLNAGERGDTSHSFSKKDATLLVQKIKDAQVTSQDIDQAMQQSPERKPSSSNQRDKIDDHTTWAFQQYNQHDTSPEDSQSSLLERT